MSHKLTQKIFLERAKPRLKEYEVISSYKDSTTKMQFRCRTCGEVFAMKPHAFLDGQGCRKCSYTLRGRQKIKTFEEFVSNLPKKYDGYIFEEYSGATAPVVAICPKCGRRHRYSTAKSFTTGLAGCRSCRRSKPDDELKDYCDRVGFEFISRLAPRKSGRYTVTQVKVKCKICGHVSRRNVSNLGRSGCKYCHNRWSRREEEIFEWVQSLCPDAQHNVRGIIDKELDIYIPSAKVAIEYNGTYWHSAAQKDKFYHSNKSKMCQSRGIRLIHVWEYEWANPRQQAVLKNIILGALHKLPERYYARSCQVKRYDKGCSRWKELNEFFARNNIQGNRGGSVVFTLEKDSRILMAYKFGRPSGGKAKQKYEYEMVRGASALGVQVIGGATRLWKHFIEEIQPKSVVYYVDFNYFDGCSVEKLGGEYVGHTQSYKNWWVKEGVVKNREPYRHHEIKLLEAKGEVYKIWNAGVLSYAFHF